MSKDKIAKWLDANVWDGDEVSEHKTSSGSHVAMFNPSELYELVVELIEDIEKADSKL